MDSTLSFKVSPNGEQITGSGTRPERAQQRGRLRGGRIAGRTRAARAAGRRRVRLLDVDLRAGDSRAVERKRSLSVRLAVERDEAEVAAAADLYARDGADRRERGAQGPAETEARAGEGFT